MLSLVRDMVDPNHPGRACLVLSNNPDAGGLTRARELGIPAEAVDHRPFGRDRAAFEARLTEVLAASGAEVLCLAGFMRILTPGFINTWAGRMINIHPSILPLFPGLHTHARAIEAGMSVHGCSVHEVTADLDAGPILGQAVIPVRDGDTPDALAERVLGMEHQLYPAVLRKFLSGDRSKTALFG